MSVQTEPLDDVCLRGVCKGHGRRCARGNWCSSFVSCSADETTDAAGINGMSLFVHYVVDFHRRSHLLLVSRPRWPRPACHGKSGVAPQLRPDKLKGKVTHLAQKCYHHGPPPAPPTAGALCLCATAGALCLSATACSGQENCPSTCDALWHATTLSPACCKLHTESGLQKSHTRN